MPALKPLLLAAAVSSAWVLAPERVPLPSAAPLTLCDIRLPDPPKKEEEPTKPDGEESQIPSHVVEFPSEIDALIAKGKLDDARKRLDGWGRDQVQKRVKSGMQKAAAGVDPEVDAGEALYIDRTAHTRYAQLGAFEWGALDGVKRMLETYGNVHVPKLHAAGMELAKQGAPDMPPQIREIVDIGKQNGLLGITLRLRTGDELRTAGEVLLAWGEVRSKKLLDEATAIAKAGERKAPTDQLREMVDISKQIAALGMDGGRYTHSTETIAHVRSVLSTWGNVRVLALRTAGTPKAEQPADVPPADEIVELLEVQLVMDANTIESGRGPEAGIEANSLADKWFRNHVNRLYAKGRAAAEAGTPPAPAEMDSIVAFTRANGCMGAKENGGVEFGMTRARQLGEAHLNAYKDKLDCVPTSAQKATLQQLVARLVAYGWGPYDNPENVCDWTGTITILNLYDSNRSDEEVGGGDGVASHMTNVDTIRYEIAVNGAQGAGRVSGRGTEQVVQRRIKGACRADSVDIVRRSTRSGEGAVPVAIKAGVAGMYEIRFPDLAHRIVIQETRFTTGNPNKRACLGADKGTTTSSMTLEMTASPPGNLLMAKPVVTPKAPGRRGSIVLNDSTLFEMKGAKRITKYQLKRSQ